MGRRELSPLPTTAPPSQTCGDRHSWVHTGHLFSMLHLWGNMEEGTLQRLCPSRTASPALPGFALPAACLGTQFNLSEWEVKWCGFAAQWRQSRKMVSCHPLHWIACILFQNFRHSSSSGPCSLQGLAHGSLYKSRLHPPFGLWSLLLSRSPHLPQLLR